MENVTDRKHGFTLVELLVVISIIALLLAVLLPALNKARDSAKKVVCSSNDKQLTTSVITYTQSVGPLGYLAPLDGQYPFITNGAAGTTLWWHQLLADQGFIKGLNKGPRMGEPVGVCRCPAVVKYDGVAYYGNDVWNTWKGIAYSINYNLSVSQKDQGRGSGVPAGYGKIRPRNLMTVPQPSDVLLICDDIPLGSPTIYGSMLIDRVRAEQTLNTGGWAKYFVTRHGGVGIIGYVDGHVGYRKSVPTDPGKGDYIAFWGNPAY